MQPPSNHRVATTEQSRRMFMPGTVQIHYEIEGVLLNNKDYVSGKDPVGQTRAQGGSGAKPKKSPGK